MSSQAAPNGTADSGAPFGRPGRRRAAPRVTGCADILADGSGRLGLLSYVVPDELAVAEGDAVRIPFGKRETYGVVVGPGNPAKATREILEVYGKRTDPSDIALARAIAKHHFAALPTVLTRLAPKTGRGADPVDDLALTLADDLTGPPPLRPHPGTAPRRLLVRAPLVDPAALAAHEARRLAAAAPDAQVLILCPTVDLVARTQACFAAGAQRLDAAAAKGAWKGFCAGTVRVGIGTRAAALYSAAHLAGIIVVEEDHPGHLEATQPHTHARDIASARSRSLRVPLTLISATPTPQAVGAVTAVTAAGLRSDWPKMTLIDRSDIDPMQRWLPPAMRRAVAAAERAGHTPVVVAQRKAATRRCRRCSTPRPCADCESSLCRHPEPAPCPTCQSTDGVAMRGWDADRISDLFQGRARVVTLAQLADVRDAGLVILFDVDAALTAAELIPESLAANLVVAAAQAAGRGGHVVAGTFAADQPLLADLFGPRDQIAVARRASSAARAAGLPPFGRLVTIRAKRDAAPSVAGWPGQVHGPRRAGSEWEILVRIATADLADLLGPLTKLRRGGKVRLTIS